MEPRLALAKAAVIHNCVSSQSDVSATSPLPNWSGEPFLLCVAQHRRNKNLLFLLRVFERLLRTRAVARGTRLVIVGIPGPETSAILHFIAVTGIADRVALLNGLSDEELQWCYRNSALLLAPSFIEGFGLPVAEALLAGCQVICSDIAAFREVGADRCLYISLDAQAEQAFCEVVRTAMGQPSPQPVALPQLSASFIAEQYLQLYRSLLYPTSACDAPALGASVPASEGNHAI